MSTGTTDGRWSEQALLPFLAGCVAGGAGIAVGHPLDTTKTLQQVQKARAENQSGKSSLRLIKVAANVYTQNGISGFFRGLLYPLAASGFVNAAFFGAMELSKRMMPAAASSDVPQDVYKRAYAAGVLGGIAQIPFVVPAEVVKVQMQAQLRLGHLERCQGGLLGHSALIVRQQGVRGLYRGTVVTAIRDIPTYGVYMVMFEFVKTQLDVALGTRDGAVAELIAGGCAGVTSWTLATPADVIKSRVQASSAPQDAMMWHAASSIYREAGLGGFARGWPALVTRAFVTNAVTFFVYMNLLRWLWLLHNGQRRAE